MEDEYKVLLEKDIKQLILAINADIINKEVIDELLDKITGIIDKEIELGTYVDIKEIEEFDYYGDTFNELLTNRLVEIGRLTSNYYIDIDNLRLLLDKVTFQVDFIIENGKFESVDMDMDSYLELEKFLLNNIDKFIEED